MQGQLLITGKEYCDFVVWTPKGIVIDRIHQDFYFTEKLSQKLTVFYVDFMISAIVGFTLSSRYKMVQVQHMINQNCIAFANNQSMVK